MDPRQRDEASPFHVGTWKRGFDRYPHLVAQFRLEPSRVALVIIDMQNRAVKPEYGGNARLLQETHPHLCGYFLTRGQQLVVPTIRRLLGFFRRHQLRVIYLTVGPFLPDGADLVVASRDGYREMERETGVRAMHPVGTPAHAIIDELYPVHGELVINKTSASPFNSTLSDATLRILNIDTLICTGLATNGCVEMTARDASDRGNHVYLVDDACVTYDQEMHDACLRTFAVFHGFVVSTDEMLAELEAAITNSAVLPRSLSGG
jgi:nicotinamidase-related amidase